MKVSEPPQHCALAVDLAGDENPKPMTHGLEAPCAAIESLVVEPAQRQAVAHVIRPARRMPLDVSSLKPKQLVAEPDVVVAHSASTLIGA